MKKNSSVLLICVLLCAAILFAFASIAMIADHDCIGEECHVCVELQQAKSLLKDMASAVALLAFAICLPTGIAYALGNADHIFDFDTPITLRVKLLN